MTDLYQSQRAMRHMRRAAMQRGVVAILDVGTSKIACLVLRFDGIEDDRDHDGVGPMGLDRLDDVLKVTVNIAAKEDRAHKALMVGLHRSRPAAPGQTGRSRIHP